MGGDDSGTSYGPEGRGFYGAVTVGERGQIVIPAQARRDLGIEAGDKLLVLGDPEQGLALAKLEMLMQNLQNSATLLRQVQGQRAPEAEDPGGTDE
jgi:AbrB family looped-hinge helix DNA binding protein